MSIIWFMSLLRTLGVSQIDLNIRASHLSDSHAMFENLDRRV